MNKTKLEWKKMFPTCNGSIAIVEESLWKFKRMAATNGVQSLRNAIGKRAFPDIIAISHHENDMGVKIGRVLAADVATHLCAILNRCKVLVYFAALDIVCCCLFLLNDFDSRAVSHIGLSYICMACTHFDTSVFVVAD